MGKENNFTNMFFLLAFIVLFFYILSIGANLIIPFIIAVLFSFAIVGLSDFFKKFSIPPFFAMILSLLTYIFFFWLIGKMINTNIQDVINLLPRYQERLSSLYLAGLNYFNIPQNIDAYSLFQKINITSIFTSVISSVTEVFSKAGLIFFYVLFILLEYRFFGEKIKLMFLNNKKRQNTIDIISKIKSDVKAYFLIKTIVSLITGILSYLVMIVFDLDFALFWSMIIFFLNFIPNIGSVIAISFPIILSLIQYDSLYPFFFIFSGLIGVQMLMGDIIEPKFMGNKLNLSPLVIIIALGFWGTLWGIVGMLLSVPLMVILNIILSKFETTRPIAILLSEKGVLDIDNEINIDFHKTNFVQKIRKKINSVIKKNK